MPPTEITFTERLLTAFFCALLVFLIDCFGPLVLYVKTAGIMLDMNKLYAGFHIWATLTTMIGAITGFIAGPDQAITLFGHLCGTEIPRRPDITTMLGAILVGTAVVGYLLAL